MNDTEPETTHEAIESGFDRAWDTMHGEEPAPKEESVVKSDTSPPEALDAAPAEAQSEPTVEPPGAADPKELAKALDDIRRSGLKDADLSGKSEEYILELGRECDTLKRQRDRERTERQNQEREAVGQSPSDAASDEPSGEADTPPQGATDTPATPEVDFTPLVEEFGEEAARPVIDALESMKRENAALQAKFDAQEQERQLAPVLEQANEALDGMVGNHPDLSKPEIRTKVLESADRLGAAYTDKYGALPKEEQLAAVLQDAVNLELGPGIESGKAKPRNKAEAPAANSNDVPRTPPGTQREVISEGFDRAWRKQYGSRK